MHWFDARELKYGTCMVLCYGCQVRWNMNGPDKRTCWTCGVEVPRYGTS